MNLMVCFQRNSWQAPNVASCGFVGKNRLFGGLCIERCNREGALESWWEVVNVLVELGSKSEVATCC